MIKQIELGNRPCDLDAVIREPLSILHPTRKASPEGCTFPEPSKDGHGFRCLRMVECCAQFIGSPLRVDTLCDVLA